MQKTTNTFEGGLVRLNNKTKQPKNSYSYALNATISDSIIDQTSRSNERGFENYLTIGTRQFNILKAQWLGKEQYVFFIKHLEGAVDTFNEIWYVDKEKDIQRLVYSNIGLNFQDDYEISSTYRINYKTERIVYWVDGLNDDRVINVDDLDSVSLDITLLSIESNYTKAELQATVFDTGGSLVSGQYFLAVAYNLGDSFTTSAFGLSNPISIASKNYFYQDLGDDPTSIPDNINKQFGDTDGDLPNTPTRKSIQVHITNLDSNFDSINLIVINVSNGANTIKVVEKISTKGLTELTYRYTGNTGKEDTTINVNDITVDSVKYYASEVIAQKENRLVRGNSKLKATGINYQTFANDIKIGYTISEELVYEDSIVNHKFHGSPQGIYDPATELYKQHSASPTYLSKTAHDTLNSKTFMRDEVYSLGVGLELVDGTETDIFHIPGRQLNTFESTIGIGEYDRDLSVDSDTWDNDIIDGQARWLTMNTAVKRVDEIGELSYWESEENYSPDFNFPTGKIRHHRMPSDILEPIYRTEITGDPNVTDTPVPYKIYKRHLALVASNIVIPDEYKDIVKKVKIYYTPRNDSNKSILSKGLCYQLNTDVTPNEQAEHMNSSFTDSTVGSTKLEFVSPEVNFKFKETSLAASKMKVCGIDKGYVSYAGLYNPNLVDNQYLIRIYNNELHDTKQREQVMISGLCFYNQRAIPQEHLYSFDINSAIFLDSNFLGSTVGFDVDFKGGQETALISLVDPIVLVPIVLTDQLLNTYYPELLYPTTAEKPSDLYPYLHIPDGTDPDSFYESQQSLNYDTAYYVSLVNENRSLYNDVESLEYINSGSYVIYNNEASVTIPINSGDTYIDVHHFKKTSIKLLKLGEEHDSTYNVETTDVSETVKVINEFGAASYCSFFVETDINIRMRNEGSEDDERYFPKSFYSGSKMRDYGRSIDELEYYNIEEGYQTQYLKLYFANNQTQEDFERIANNDIRYSTRLIYSDKQDLEDKTDRYRIVRANNYRDLPLDRGPLSGLFTKQEKLYALTRDALFDIYASNQTIKSENGDNITVGTGEFFANEPTELIAIEGGFGGTTSKYSICETPYGYLFVDRFKNKCILFNDGLKDINIIGLNENFKLELFKQIPELEKDSSFDNPLSNAGIISIYDPKLKRIIVSKKDYELLAPYKGVFDNSDTYNVGDVVFKDNVLQRVDGIVDTNIINTSNFSDWTINNTNTSSNNMQLIDAPTKGTIVSSDLFGVDYQATNAGVDSFTVNQSGLTCGSKETITVENIGQPVNIDWQMLQKNIPYVNGDFNFYKDGVLMPKSEFTSDIGFVVGDTIEIRFFHYAENYRWPDDAFGTLNVENAAEDLLYTYTGGSRDVNAIHTYSFVLTEDYYYIYATTDSADSSLAPLGFDVNNTSDLNAGLLNITAIDNTTGLTMLKISESNDQGSYNVENDGGTQNITMQNTSLVDVTVRLRTTTASFDETYAVVAGATVTKAGITKAGIIIDIT